jgi:CRISPR-associated exonuclease Cas4
MTIDQAAPGASMGGAPTGKSVFYLHSCPVLAWLFLRGALVVSPTNEYIRSGTRLDEERWAHRRSLDLAPYGKCDWVTGAQTAPVIHEGTRSKQHSDPKRAQLRHYLWAARQLYGIEAQGLLHLAGGHTEEVFPDDPVVERDHAALRKLAAESMPAPKKIPICRGCTNRDWCWA